MPFVRIVASDLGSICDIIEFCWGLLSVGDGYAGSAVECTISPSVYAYVLRV